MLHRAQRLKAALTPKVLAVEVNQTLEDQRLEGRRSLYAFVKMAWPLVEPARPFVDGWHIRAICAHLQAVTEGLIRNLIINMPPRHMKSSLVAVLWPAWEWIDHPGNAFLTSAYADKLSIRDAVRARRVIQSAWYRERWGDSFRLTADQNAKVRYDNDRGGYRIATSVSGLGTGEGGDRIVVDDPINVKEATSEAVRESTNTWWDETMSSRGNDPRTVAKVIVMQRIHHDDLVGHILEKMKSGDGERYDLLCLPAEFERAMPPTSIGWTDPRTTPGELLWPERFGRPEVDALKSALGSYAAAAQLQQHPTPRGGGVFKLEWFRQRWHQPPVVGMKRVSVDCANKKTELNGNSYSVAGAFREFDNQGFLLDLWRERVEYPDLKRKVISFCEKHTPNECLIEDKGNGIALIQDLRANTRIPVIAIEPEGEKEMRAQRTSPSCEAGLLVLPYSAPWMIDFETELTQFPMSAFNDQVDMLTQYLDRFARGSTPSFASSGTRAMTGINR
jgi:predicted phage terminase large subunit-like protein